MQNPTRSFGIPRPEALRTFVALALMLALWLALTRVVGLSQSTLPDPESVLAAWWDALTTNQLLPDVLVSMKRLLLGSAVGIVTGVLFGIAVGLSAPVRVALEPLVNAMSGISGIAWIPLALAWFGTGLTMSTFVIWNGMFFVVFANTALGVSRVPVALSQSIRTMGGSRWEVFRTVTIPGALPDIFTGMRVGLSFGWRSLIAAELLGAPEGLGQWINESAALTRSDRILAGCITIAVLGVLLERLVVTVAASRTVVRWGTITDAAARRA
jgi:ABC-type nitrate/sulfonate/bicarbonate transport system permease component